MGTIPACAGEPWRCCFAQSGGWDYPRVRGGTVSPASVRQELEGLSPRARGNRNERGNRAERRGTIPACAGEPFRIKSSDSDRGDYPRVRGGTQRQRRLITAFTGLSPRARGNRRCYLHPECLPGTIPACAGEPQLAREAVAGFGDYPRVRGGTLNCSRILEPLNGLSPRARGNHPGGLRPRPHFGTIPACAGEPVLC